MWCRHLGESQLLVVWCEWGRIYHVLPPELESESEVAMISLLLLLPHSSLSPTQSKAPASLPSASSTPTLSPPSKHLNAPRASFPPCLSHRYRSSWRIGLGRGILGERIFWVRLGGSGSFGSVGGGRGRARRGGRGCGRGGGLGRGLGWRFRRRGG